jgi:UDPglucose 6-dehydrogenase
VNLFVVGAGYVGLTTAAVFARLGHAVLVHDVDEARVELLRAGRSPIFEPGVEDAVRAGLADGSLQFTADPAPPAATEVALVCVPTPSAPDGLLDIAAVESVVVALSARLPADRTIAVRSTLPLHGPERLEAISATAGGPAILVNPEFMREGSALADAGQPSRVVVGWLRPGDLARAEQLADLYAPLGAPTLVADARSVVLLKLASNVFLATKITFANELARLSDAIGADIATVADGLGLDPRIGRSFLEAGPGFGGSCLPEQAEAIAIEAGSRELRTPLMSSVARANEVHQAEIARTIASRLPDGAAGARVALLGLSFKANTGDVRNSPALALARELRALGAAVAGYDPVAGPAAQAADPALDVVDGIGAAAAGADALVVVTEWEAFRHLDWASLARAMRGKLVYDSRRIVDAAAVRAADLEYVGLGRAGRTAVGAARS